MSDNHQNQSKQQAKQKRFARIMAWILSILMMGSCATLIVSLILYFLGV